MSSREPINIAKDLAKEYKNKNFNEADTRHKIIDEVIHNVLSWPKNMVRCETYHNPDYSDYLLVKNESVKLFIEAKKEKFYFELPNGFNSDKNAEYVPISILYGDGKSNIAIAMEQVRKYCDSEACEFACITNGHEWIFFKALSIGKPWKKFKAYVIKNLDFFNLNHIEAINNLGYKSIIDDNSLHKLFTSSEEIRNIFYPHEKINAYDEPVKNNNLSSFLKPIVDKYFGDFSSSNLEFFNECYIDDREYTNAYKGIRNKLKDTLSPFFEDKGIMDFIDSKSGGAFGERIEEYLANIDSEEVIVLFGGKGAGKSTFIKKLFFANIPSYLQNNSIPIIVDMLKVPLTEENLHDEIWMYIIEQLDKNRVLFENRDILIDTLYKEKYDLALNQELYGLSKDSESFNIRLNDLLRKWKDDLVFTAKSLRNYWIENNKGIVIVIDNTDQFEEKMQDKCFSIAQEISNKLKCLSIISMREERYYKSTICGTLDAFQNTGFHISAPSPQKVFLKRIRYILNILEDDNNYNQLLHFKNITKRNNLIKIFQVLEHEFEREPNSDLNEFLTACAHSNIRIALELFRNLTISGYFNVREMIASKTLWKLKIHQVLKPIMVPDRFFYNETTSSVPNIFQIRETSNGSHFTSLRILNILSKNINTNEMIYKSYNELKDHFMERYKIVNDFKKSLDILLRFRLVETSNRVDEFYDDIDELKITTYGYFLLKNLVKEFTYLELVSSNTGVYLENTCNEIYEYSNEDFRLTQQSQKNTSTEKSFGKTNLKIIERIENRLKKVETFLEYLAEEEKNESNKFNLLPEELYMGMIQEYFNEEKKKIIDNANGNYGMKQKV